MFTFLPHSDLAKKQGHIRFGKGKIVCVIAAYVSFAGSNHWENPSLRNLLRNHTVLSYKWSLLPGVTSGQNIMILDQWKSHRRNFWKEVYVASLSLPLQTLWTIRDGAHNSGLFFML